MARRVRAARAGLDELGLGADGPGEGHPTWRFHQFHKQAGRGMAGRIIYGNDLASWKVRQEA